MTALLEVADLRVEFPVGRRRRLPAVDGVDLTVKQGEILGLVGESGCGKSTLARTLVGLQAPSAGLIRLGGKDVPARRPAALRKRIQLVFQDPGSSLDPRQTVREALQAPLRVHKLTDRAGEEKRVRELLNLVELSERLLDAKPGRLSGGQRQRVAIARALAVEPDILIADEAVSALDASATGSVLNLLTDLRTSLGLTVVFISHDLSVVRSLCDRVAVMYLGRVVETGSVEEVFTRPRHPYLRALLASIPRIGEPLVPPPLEGDEPPSILTLPTGCRFTTRCPLAEQICREQEPILKAIGPGAVACHLV
ncbi:ABC transporter ATP-binding protein [Amycolatopsis pithecellobii]|uniref:ABC transporter ATP-binding protein n=1 Tax=Amycolatopsis pithecellobii TaxID=664692 RepID=UPI0028A61E1F|nr:ABC transporter ATP-binding protein [Amycolatopsis pithecellobii]